MAWSFIKNNHVDQRIAELQAEDYKTNTELNKIRAYWSDNMFSINLRIKTIEQKLRKDDMDLPNINFRLNWLEKRIAQLEGSPADIPSTPSSNNYALTALSQRLEKVELNDRIDTLIRIQKEETYEGLGRRIYKKLDKLKNDNDQLHKEKIIELFEYICQNDE